MNRSYCDKNGVEFIMDDSVGAEKETRFSTLVNKVNFDILLDKAIELDKKISYFVNENIKDLDLKDSDIAVNIYNLGGAELLVKNVPENKLLIEMIRFLEDYPCLDDAILQKREQEMISEVLDSDEFYYYIEHFLTSDEKSVLTDIELSYNTWSELSSCPIYTEDFSPKEILDNEMLVKLIAKDLNFSSIDDFDAGYMSEENRQIMQRNLTVLKEWHAQQCQSNPCPE